MPSAVHSEKLDERNFGQEARVGPEYVALVLAHTKIGCSSRLDSAIILLCLLVLEQKENETTVTRRLPFGKERIPNGFRFWIS